MGPIISVLGLLHPDEAQSHNLHHCSHRSARPPHQPNMQPCHFTWESSEVIISIYRINVRFRLCLLELYHLGQHVRHLAHAWLLIVANVAYLLVNYVGIICRRTLVISMSIVVPHSTVGVITFLATSLIITCTDQDQPLSSQYCTIALLL